MKPVITVQISEGLGNQMFMYSFAYSISKSLGYDLFIDNKSGYSRDKNLFRSHQKYMLNSFNIEGKLASDEMLYNTSFKRFKKKFSIFLDNFKYKKKFLIEKQYKRGSDKIAEEFIHIDKSKISNNLYIQGNFENYKYFNHLRSDLCKILIPNSNLIKANNPLIYKIKNSNSISLHIRRNRFSDQFNLKKINDFKKSENFTSNIIKYINNSLDIINSKVNNPEYFIWSNDHENILPLLNKLNINNFTLVNNDVINDFNLFRYCKHFIVGPSSFHWWGAWLNENPNKICIRPIDINPSNNKNFWPNDWLSI
ncbi:alpha-1,2-fucosyltransferase [Candidatus Pelagibacter sp.]|nr:alpha-1,2-fucosyltransferase [Candidatus Pelagibacter sp.]